MRGSKGKKYFADRKGEKFFAPTLAAAHLPAVEVSW
jgi:hypothetical protein